MRLTQQGVEAVVEVGTQAKVSSIAGAVQRAIVVLHWWREQRLVLVDVGRLVEVILLEGGEKGCFLLEH